MVIRTCTHSDTRSIAADRVIGTDDQLRRRGNLDKDAMYRYYDVFEQASSHSPRRYLRHTLMF